MSTEWSDPGRVAEYLSREIPHRVTAEAMLLEALPPRVGRFLDLGTGDGRMLALREGGFAEADCHFKWLELALVVATR